MVAITSWIVDDWPFSMVRFLDFYTMIFQSDGTNVDLYEAYCGTDDVWVGTKVIEDISTINAPTVYPVNIDFADFGWFYALAYAEMSSGAIDAKCFYRDPDIAAGVGAINTLATVACPEFLTCCNFKGQAILGGIVSTDANWTQLGMCSVAWGAIGQFEFRPSQNRTAGYMRMPWSDQDEGLVLKVARLGDAVMVYGNGGRAAMIPFTQSMATGFGLRDDISGPGISKGFHMAGGKDIHGFIDTDNEFWVGGKDLQFKKLGYKEYIDAMQVENDAQAADLPIIVSYSPNDKRFYLGGYSSGYVLTEFGLYSTHQSLTSVGRYRGGVLTGYYKDLGDYEARISVDDSDFEVRGLKTVDTIEYGLDYPSKGSGAALAPTNCCTDKVTDADVTTGWTASVSVLDSIAGGATGNCLSVTNAGYAYAVASLTIDKWYHFQCRLKSAAAATYKVQLRYNTETTDEYNSGTVDALASWEWFGYCFKADYTDADFRIMLHTINGNAMLFDDVILKEVLVEGAIDFSYDYNESDRSSSWIRLSPQGVITPIVTANDFKFKLRATDYRATGFNLDYINTRYKLVDKRGVRGPYNVNKIVG